MLKTIRETDDVHLRNFQIPQTAKQQLEIFKDEFQNYLSSLDSPVTCSKLQNWIKDIMELKLELLISHHHHKIALVPPGMLFDPTLMCAGTEEGDDVILGTNSQYRVCLCLVPALISGIEDTKWSFDDMSGSSSPDHDAALLESRNFFLDEPGKW